MIVTGITRGAARGPPPHGHSHRNRAKVVPEPTRRNSRAARRYHTVSDVMLGQRMDPASPAMNAKLQHLKRQKKEARLMIYITRYSTRCKSPAGPFTCGITAAGNEAAQAVCEVVR